MTQATRASALADRADRLLRAHHEDSPLLLPNVWDVASARAVATAGFAAVASSSRAVAQVLGLEDDDSSDPDVIFGFLARIAAAVDVPVTADLESGFQLPEVELVDRMLEAGLVGCNLEDSDHHGDGMLVSAERQAERLAAVRAAASRRGVQLVINARIDTFIRRFGDEADRVAETVRRARLYLEAGADCVYPIAVSNSEDAAKLVSEIAGPVNLVAHDVGAEVAAWTKLGAKRISFGAWIFGQVAARHRELIGALGGGGDKEP